jgi:hypothetical protein
MLLIENPTAASNFDLSCENAAALQAAINKDNNNILCIDICFLPVFRSLNDLIARVLLSTNAGGPEISPGIPQSSRGRPSALQDGAQVIKLLGI